MRAKRTDVGWIAACLLLLASALIVGDAMAKKNRVPEALTSLVERVSAGRGNFFVRNSLDTDPSSYIGRFVPADAGFDVDDAMAMQTMCSDLVSHEYVGGGGVQYDEYFNASTAVSAGLNAPLLSTMGLSVGASFGYNAGTVVRVHYTLTGKMIAKIDDTAAFAACCEENPDQCTQLYLGEFLEGTGEIYHLVGKAGRGGGSGSYQGVGGELEIRDGLEWSRSVTFPNPVYFAFKTSAVPGFEPCEPCGDWVDRVPNSKLGEYFVGVSDAVPSQVDARDMAMDHAREQVIKFIGEAIAMGKVETRATGGEIGSLRSRMDQEEFVERAAEGIARFVKDRCWCVREVPTPSGTYYEAKVLAFLPESQLEEAAEAVVEVSP